METWFLLWPSILHYISMTVSMSRNIMPWNYFDLNLRCLLFSAWNWLQICHVWWQSGHCVGHWQRAGRVYSDHWTHQVQRTGVFSDPCQQSWCNWWCSLWNLHHLPCLQVHGDAGAASSWVCQGEGPETKCVLRKRSTKGRGSTTLPVVGVCLTGSISGFETACVLNKSQPVNRCCPLDVCVC